MNEDMNLLLLEDADGMTEPYFLNQIKKDLKSIKSWMPELVILSSCESENIGDEFLEFVSHVISIKDKVEVKDKAAIWFAQAFYSNLFIKR